MSPPFIQRELPVGAYATRGMKCVHDAALAVDGSAWTDAHLTFNIRDFARYLEITADPAMFQPDSDMVCLDIVQAVSEVQQNSDAVTFLLYSLWSEAERRRSVAEYELRIIVEKVLWAGQKWWRSIRIYDIQQPLSILDLHSEQISAVKKKSKCHISGTIRIDWTELVSLT